MSADNDTRQNPGRVQHRRERVVIGAVDVALARRARAMTVPECRQAAAQLLGRPVPTLGTLTPAELRRLARALRDTDPSHH